MKQTIITAMLLLGMSCTAQTEVQELELYKGMNTKVVRTVFDKDTSFTIRFRDANYTQIIRYSHLSFVTKADLQTFVETCLKATETGSDYLFENCSVSKFMGGAMVVTTKPGSPYFTISKNQLSKLLDAIK